MKQVTEKSFYKYLKCPSWISREARDGGDQRDAIMQKLQDDGLLKEKELELLKSRPYETVDLDDVEEAAQRTLELMKQGTETIYKGILIDGNRVGNPDVLEKVEGKSDLGDWYYVAVDIKRSRHLKDEYKFQGVFYAELLKIIQGKRPVQGYVMHADATVDSYLIEEFETDFHLTLDRIEAILDGEEEPHFLTSACKQSPWFSECKVDSRKCDSLSQINRIWRNEVHALQDAGITSVSRLADAKMEDLKKVSGITMDRLYFIQQQAMSLADGEIIRMGQPEFPEESGVALVIDIESDPLRDSDYLFGVLVVGGEEETYHPFLASDPKNEEEAWKSFVEFLKDYEGANIYHYGWYEQDVFRRKTEMYGAPPEIVRMFEENMIDVLGHMREKVIFPTPFYSLKDVAKHLGFKWRHPEASGLNSVLWFHEWLATGDETALQDIVDYNEDDVRATWLVRNWAVNE